MTTKRKIDGLETELTYFGSTHIVVDVVDLPDGSGEGISIQFADVGYLIPLDGAEWLSDAIKHQIERARGSKEPIS